MIFFQNLSQYKEIAHGILEKKDGPVNPFSIPESEENLLNVLSFIGAQRRVEDIVYMEQIHSKRVYRCPSKKAGYIKLRTDGLITNYRKQVLVVKTADCIPILMYNPYSREIGAIHAGRKGIVKGILEEAVKTMKGRASYLVVGIGPHIRKDCYSLRDDSSEPFCHLKELEKDKDKRNYLKPPLRKYIEEKEGRVYFDLTNLAYDKLLNLGVKGENIEDLGLCSLCEGDKFYSARRRAASQEGQERNMEDGRLFPCTGSFITRL